MRTVDRQLSWIVGFLRWWVVEGRFGGPVDPIIVERRQVQARIGAEMERLFPEVHERARAAFGASSGSSGTER